MTDEELFASIYTHDTIYLPPSEQHSAALETVLGCSHAKCRFCDFARDPFRIHPMEQIRRNMQILGRFRPDAHRLFLLGENAFVLDYHMLNEIFDMTDSFMTRYLRVYSRVDDIARKTRRRVEVSSSDGPYHPPHRTGKRKRFHPAGAEQRRHLHGYARAASQTGSSRD